MINVNKSDLWKQKEIEQKKFYLDNPEEEGFPWTEAGIRCWIELMKQRKELEDLKKVLYSQ